MAKDKKPAWPPMSLTPEEAAYELRISRAELFKRIGSGEIPSSLLGPQIRRIARSDVEEYLKSKRDKQEPEPGAA